MSYDIYFVRRDPGQSFEDALEEIEDSFEGDPGPLSTTQLELWDDLLGAARAVLGEVEVFEDAVTRELVHHPTGVQLSLFNGEVAIHVPDTGDVGGVMATVHDLARAVERATGLEGYDPQLGEAVSDSDSDLDGEDDDGPAPLGRRSASSWDDEAESDGTSTTLPAVRARRTPAAAGAGASVGAGSPGEPRWWEFWKR